MNMMVKVANLSIAEFNKYISKQELSNNDFKNIFEELNDDYLERTNRIYAENVGRSETLDKVRIAQNMYKKKLGITDNNLNNQNCIDDTNNNTNNINNDDADDDVDNDVDNDENNENSDNEVLKIETAKKTNKKTKAIAKTTKTNFINVIKFVLDIFVF